MRVSKRLGKVECQFTFHDLLTIPKYRTPAFPPYCVECSEPATSHHKETVYVNRKLGEKPPEGSSSDYFKDRGIYETLEVTLELPVCEEHKEAYTKASKSLWISGASASVLAVLALVATMYLVDKLFPNVAVGVICFGGVIVAAVVLAGSINLLSKLLEKMMHFEEPSRVSVSKVDDKTEKGGEVLLQFGDQAYARMFAEENELPVQ